VPRWVRLPHLGATLASGDVLSGLTKSGTLRLGLVLAYRTQPASEPDGMGRRNVDRDCRYCPLASRYLATTSASTRPRSLMLMPRSLAQARTTWVSIALGPRRDLPARRVPPTLRACAMYGCKLVRSACCAPRSGRSRTQRRLGRSGRCPRPHCRPCRRCIGSVLSGPRGTFRFFSCPDQQSAYEVGNAHVRRHAVAFPVPITHVCHYLPPSSPTACKAAG
jgi:hypothetical protein